jgi:hypothetical protein
MTKSKKPDVATSTPGIDGKWAEGQIEKKIAEAKVFFTVHDPWLYDKILLVKDGTPYLETHVVVPVKSTGDPGGPEFLAMKPAVDIPQKMSDPDLKTMNEYLLRCIAIARLHLENFPDQSDHDVRYAIEALEIDDPKWRDRVYDPEVLADQRKTIDGLHAEITKIEATLKMANASNQGYSIQIMNARDYIATLESDITDCSCEKWKKCARHKTGKCRICDGETYYIEKQGNVD